MKLGTVRMGDDTTRAFQRHEDHAEFYEARDVGELLSTSEWQSLPTQRGSLPEDANPITGETKYGVTLEEHNANVRELTAYCDENPKDCGQ